jgi:hypothetical protein
MFPFLEEGILDLVKIKWCLVIPYCRILELSKVLFKIYISPLGHALKCSIVSKRETQIRGHVEPLSLNKTKKLMGDVV